MPAGHLIDAAPTSTTTRTLSGISPRSAGAGVSPANPGSARSVLDIRACNKEHPGLRVTSRILPEHGPVRAANGRFAQGRHDRDWPNSEFP